MIREIIEVGLGLIAAGTTTALIFTTKALFASNKHMDEAFKRVMDTTKTNAELATENAFVKASNTELRTALAESQGTLLRERAAREYAEGQRDELLKKLPMLDTDGSVTADGINDELRKLKALMPTKQGGDSKGK